MNRYIIPYILLAVCLFTSCGEDFHEPGTAPAEAISLSVCDAGFTAAGGSLSRSSDADATTVFEKRSIPPFGSYDMDL